MTPSKKQARIAGLLYLVVILTGLFSEVFVRQTLRISNNAIATAQNISAHEMLFRWGFVADIINFVVGIPCVIIVYNIFKSVNKLLVQLALALVIVQTAIISVNILNQISPLLVLSNESYLQAFEPNQLAALTLLSLNIQAQGYAVGLVFFGCYCAVLGYVLYQSNHVPKILGVLYIISGIGYLINSFTMFLSKGFANPFFIYLAIPIFIGEFAFCMWLLIKGVEDAKLDKIKAVG